MAPENYEPETAFHYGSSRPVTSVCPIVEITTSLFEPPAACLRWREITSTPYVWAGSDWPWQFVEKIAAGRLLVMFAQS
jgi:hypothetical protein